MARDEGRLDGGALVRRGRGGRFEARVQRERRMVVRGVGRGLLLPADGGEGMFDDVCGHDSVHVLAGRFVTDLMKGCERIACPGETMEGECLCPAEVVYHSDGTVYLMEESGERDVRREHDGYVSGSWSIVRRVVCDPRRGQGHSVSGGAAERVRVAGDEQLDGGASAMQRVNDGLRVAHVRSDGRVERA